MSRIAKAPITVAKGVDVKIDGRQITVKGSKGTMELAVHPIGVGQARRRCYYRDASGRYRLGNGGNDAFAARQYGPGLSARVFRKNCSWSGLVIAPRRRARFSI